MSTKVKITLEVEMGAGDPVKLMGIVKSIFCDALGEFRTVRTPARRYVENRYELDPAGEEQKIDEVEMRARWAEEFRNKAASWDAYSHTFEDTTPIEQNSWWKRKSDGLMFRCDHEVTPGVYYFYLENGMAYAKSKGSEVRDFAECIPDYMPKAPKYGPKGEYPHAAD